MRLALAVAVALVWSVGLAVMGRHPGAPGPYLVHLGCWTACALLAGVGRPSASYSALVLMWTLGFPVKIIVHLLFGYPYQEPFGAFAGTSAQWDAALAFSSAGLAGAALGRAATLRLPTPENQPCVPAWYAQAPGAVWAAVGIALLGIAVINVWATIYRIGMHPELTLPWRGHVLVAWTIALGGGLVVATLVDMEVLRQPGGRRPALLAAPCLEAIVASTAALSRGIVLFRLLPYWLVALSPSRGRLVRRRDDVGFAIACVAALALTVLLVTAERATRFTRAARQAAVETTQRAPADVGPDGPGVAAGEPASPTELPVASRATIITVQLRNLLVDRWLGLEGVMTVTAAASVPSLRDVLVARSDAGMDGWYQRLARPPYLRMEGFTFLTLPGPMALLAVTGHPWAVGLGILLGVTGLIVMEWCVQRLAVGPHLPAMAAVALANYFVQMHAPYTFLVFLLQLLVTVVVLHLVTRPSPPAWLERRR